jgi:hypothetical protein
MKGSKRRGWVSLLYVGGGVWKAEEEKSQRRFTIIDAWGRRQQLL